MTDYKDCVTPTSPEKQAAQTNTIPGSTEGHKNPEWTPLQGHCFPQSGNVK